MDVSLRLHKSLRFVHYHINIHKLLGTSCVLEGDEVGTVTLLPISCFLFAASSDGDVYVCSYPRLIPSTSRIPFCNKEHHRISLGCGAITSLTCAGDTGLIVGDSRGSVHSLTLVWTVCKQMKEINSMDGLLDECYSLVLSYLSDSRLSRARWSD